MPKPSTLENPKAVVIYNLRHGYWRPLSRGYTYSLLEAGIYENPELWRVEDKVELAEEVMKELKYTDIERDYISARSKRDLSEYETGRKEE